METLTEIEKFLALASERELRLILAYMRGLLKNHEKDQQRM